MRVVLLRDYQHHRKGDSIVIPTNEGDWLLSVGFACDPKDAARHGLQDTLGTPLIIDQRVVDQAVADAKKAVKKKIADPKE